MDKPHDRALVNVFLATSVCHMVEPCLRVVVLLSQITCTAILLYQGSILVLPQKPGLATIAFVY